MRLKIFMLLTVLLLLLNPGFSQKFKLLTPPILDLGTVPGDSVASGVIRFKNAGEQPMTISKVNTSCGCTAASLEKYTYQPGEEGELPVEFNTKGYRGTTRKSVTITMENASPSAVRVVIQATVRPKVAIEPAYVDLQKISMQDGKVVRTVTITNNMKREITGKVDRVVNDRIRVEPEIFTVAPDSAATLTIFYTPLKSGRDNGSIGLKFSKPENMKKNVPVFVNVIP